MKIFVGNLPYSVTDADLQTAFGKFGEVTSATVIVDRATGQSRGFGFVEMPDDTGQTAVEKLDGSQLAGRRIKVSKAVPKADRGDRGGDRGDRGGGGGGYRGGRDRY